ncbi:xanthine dehydrogenase accessory protein XdhC [Paenarthrobacter sp. NPDC091711]|uniref:xanthine dehydrogenase accessory protein XdhC n=1 Tax=Paenarthrobacter sp. NPDC091711 TaxID=3364385 RepID=UPI00382535C1
MDWLQALAKLRSEGIASVLATVMDVKGHAPREAGAKMVVTAYETWGTIGGGNLEASVIDRARELLSNGADSPENLTFRLNEHAPNEHGSQCCGGTASVFIEPMRSRATVAIFGIGHVGLELARILSRLPVHLLLVDSRQSQLSPERLDAVTRGTADVHPEHSAVPDSLIAKLPPGAHVLIMTHDHAEDFLLCDAAIRREDLGSLGLIGSSAKWSRFQQKLRAEGHLDTAIAQIQCPIGIPGIPGKSPAVIAISAAAALLRAFSNAQSHAG